LVDLFEMYDDARTCKLKIYEDILSAILSILLILSVSQDYILSSAPRSTCIITSRFLGKKERERERGERKKKRKGKKKKKKKKILSTLIVPRFAPV
jgi:hypothetical protein